MYSNIMNADEGAYQLSHLYDQKLPVLCTMYSVKLKNTIGAKTVELRMNPSFHLFWGLFQDGKQNVTDTVSKILDFFYENFQINTQTLILTCSLPSRVLCMVTHLLGCAPLVVIAVIRLSSSSRFSFSFFTRDSMARFAKLSDSPPWRWHMRLCTMLRHASALVGAFDNMAALLKSHRLFKMLCWCCCSADLFQEMWCAIDGQTLFISKTHLSLLVHHKCLPVMLSSVLWIL